MTLFTREAGPAGHHTTLLLHGASVTSWMWLPTMHALPDRHTLAPDLPGLGRNAQRHSFTLDGAADTLASFLRARAGAGQADVIGHSLGGAVAARLLERHPDVVRSVLLMGVTAQPLPLAGVFQAVALASQGLMRRPALLAWQAQLMRVPPEHREAFGQDLRALSRADLAQLLREAMAYRAPRHLPPTPLLALVGSREGRVNVRSARALAAATPGGQAFVVPGDHVWFARQPDLLRATLAAWLGGSPLPETLRSLHPAPVGRLRHEPGSGL